MLLNREKQLELYHQPCQGTTAFFITQDRWSAIERGNDWSKSQQQFVDLVEEMAVVTIITKLAFTILNKQ